MDGWLRRSDEWCVLLRVAETCACIVATSALAFQSAVSLSAGFFRAAFRLLGASLLFGGAAGALRCVGIFFCMGL